MTEAKAKKRAAVQTTGHAWDGDLQEFNNPLPNWWLWAFYGTVVFAIIYWVLYPAWPVGDTYTKGVMNTITFEDGAGDEITMHWNTRALFLKDMQEGREALKNREYMDKVAAVGYRDILEDAEMMAFTRSVANGIFGDNCVPCHGNGGAGLIGLFPSLADDSWLWGGDISDIENSIRNGHAGFMPAFRNSLDDRQLDDVAGFVLSLSGYEIDKASRERGRSIFQGSEGGCHYCHTSQGTGLKSQGAANLTDRVWTIADVPGASSAEERLLAVRSVVEGGVSRTMPAWSGRLSDAQIKLLTLYVHQLGGGQ